MEVIANEIRRLDDVVQGFLKFTRPEDLKLEPIHLATLLEEVAPIVRPEADRAGVTLVIDCAGAPDVNGDPAMLRQAFLNPRLLLFFRDMKKEFQYARTTRYKMSFQTIQ